MTTGGRERVQRAVLADMAALVDGILAAIVDSIPAYGTLERSQLDEVTAIARWGVTRIMELWVHGGQLDQQDLRRFEGIGAARALDGRPLPAVLRGYRVAASYVIDVLMERHGEELTGPDIADAARTWLASVDLLSEAIYLGYETSAHRLEDDRGLATSDLLRDLVIGRQSSAGALADRCRTLGITLPDQPCLVVVGGAKGAAVGPSELAALVGELVRDETKDPARGQRPPVLSTVRERYGVVLAAELDARTLGVHVEERGLVACLMEQHGLTDLDRAFRLANHCLDQAPAYVWSDRGVLVDGDAQVLALLGGRAEVDGATVGATVMRELLRPGHEHLVEGLDALLAGGDAASAAHLLGIHPQTMRYRIRRIVALTGRDPRSPWDRFVLQVARTVAR